MILLPVPEFQLIRPKNDQRTDVSLWFLGRFRLESDQHLDDVALLVLDNFGARDGMGGTEQPDRLSRRQPKVILGIDLSEVIPVDVDRLGQSNLSDTKRGDLGVKRLLTHDAVVIGDVGQSHLKRLQDQHQPRRRRFQKRSDRRLKLDKLDVRARR